MEPPDHRRIGREMAIFANDELCGSGLPLWLPAGATVRAEIERFVVELERRNGYQHVYTPESPNANCTYVQGIGNISTTTCTRRCKSAQITSCSVP
jgi:threonyl-tRNA synthetase